MDERFELGQMRVPVVQAPMAGSGITTPELVSATSEAGGLGTLAAAYRTAEQIRADVVAVRAATERPFGVNFFAPTNDAVSAGDAGDMLEHLGRWHARFGLPEPEVPEAAGEPFAEKLELMLELRPAVVSFTFGVFPEEAMRQLRDAGIFVMGTATTVREARELERAGVDAVIVQGFEAGGHRGSFATERETGMVGLMALLLQVVDTVKVPVVASGGIMDGRGIVAARALGAAAVQMGTAFLVTRESGAPKGYKELVLRASDEATTLTRAFSGRWARGIENEFMREMRAAGVEALEYPWQNALTRGLRRAGIDAGRMEVLSLWAGQAAGLGRELTVRELMAALGREMCEVVACLNAQYPTHVADKTGPMNGAPRLMGAL